MKKFLALLLCVLYCLSANICYAFEELYYLKNVDKNTIYSHIENVLCDKDFEIKNKNPLHAVSKKKSENFAIIVLQPSGQNLFYYYESNDKNKKLNKNILKVFKKNDIVYEQSKDAMHLANFSDIVYRYNTGTKKVYSFEEPKPVKNIEVSSKAQKPAQPTTLKGFAGKIGKGEKLNVYLQSGINTSTAAAGNIVNAVLKQDWTYKEYTVAPAGSVVTGTIVEASPAKLGSRNGSVDIVFNKILTPDGKTLDISTEKVEFNVTNDGKAKQVLGSTLAMALLGAAIGLGFAALGDTSNLASGAIIGASIGGGSALVTGIAQKGVDAEIPAYTDIEIVLDKPVAVVLSY